MEDPGLYANQTDFRGMPARLEVDYGVDYFYYNCVLCSCD